ncbi:MAG: glycosyltransferase [Akkermansia sp.]
MLHELSKSSPPRLSVVVPVYKVAEYLPQCLECILNQTWRDMEVICVNDGSPDHSLDILKTFQQKDSRIVIVDQQNGGSASARNAGVDIARGQWIGFVDADDQISPDMYQMMLKVADHDQSDLVVCGTVVIGGKPIDGDIVQTSACYDYSPILLNRITYSVWDKIFKRDILLNNGIKAFVGRAFEDAPVDLMYLPLCKKVSVVATPLYHYIKRDHSNTGGICIAQYMDRIEQFGMVVSRWKELDIYEEQKSVIPDILWRQIIDTIPTIPVKKHKHFLQYIDGMLGLLASNQKGEIDKKLLDELNNTFVKARILTQRDASKKWKRYLFRFRLSSPACIQILGLRLFGK